MKLNALLTCLHTHTLQHSIHVDCVEQTLTPHTNHKRKTPQTKKANKSKPQSVVCNFTTPHSHTKREKQSSKNRPNQKIALQSIGSESPLLTKIRHTGIFSFSLNE